MIQHITTGVYDTSFRNTSKKFMLLHNLLECIEVLRYNFNILWENVKMKSLRKEDHYSKLLRNIGICKSWLNDY